jgi:hypothetical protein
VSIKSVQNNHRAASGSCSAQVTAIECRQLACVYILSKLHTRAWALQQTYLEEQVEPTRADRHCNKHKPAASKQPACEGSALLARDGWLAHLSPCAVLEHVVRHRASHETCQAVAVVAAGQHHDGWRGACHSGGTVARHQRRCLLRSASHHGHP